MLTSLTIIVSTDAGTKVLQSDAPSVNRRPEFANMQNLSLLYSCAQLIIMHRFGKVKVALLLLILLCHKWLFI